MGEPDMTGSDDDFEGPILGLAVAFFALLLMLLA
jgi:hypothetical protein